MNQKYVSYLRVSTKRQGGNGLGIEAQRTAVKRYLEGKNGDVIEEFVEIESGGNNNRKKLQSALHLCKVTGSTLLIAKLDRLGRNAHFLLGLQQCNIKFVCCDIPEANEMTIGLLALIAEYERTMISKRIKEALHEAKKRGTKLGNYDQNGRSIVKYIKENGNNKAVSALKEKAQQYARNILPIIEDIKARGILSYRGIAKELGKRGILTARGGKWTAKAVSNILNRIEKQEKGD